MSRVIPLDSPMARSLVENIFRLYKLGEPIPGISPLQDVAPGSPESVSYVCGDFYSPQVFASLKWVSSRSASLRHGWWQSFCFDFCFCWCPQLFNGTAHLSWPPSNCLCRSIPLHSILFYSTSTAINCATVRSYDDSVCEIQQKNSPILHFRKLMQKPKVMGDGWGGGVDILISLFCKQTCNCVSLVSIRNRGPT